jgi:hypothetical protein
MLFINFAVALLFMSRVWCIQNDEPLSNIVNHDLENKVKVAYKDLFSVNSEDVHDLRAASDVVMNIVAPLAGSKYC